MNRQEQFYYELVTKSNIRFTKLNNSTFVCEHLFVTIQLDNKIRLETNPQRVCLGDFPFEVYDDVHSTIVDKYKLEVRSKVDNLKKTIEKLKSDRKSVV